MRALVVVVAAVLGATQIGRAQQAPPPTGGHAQHDLMSRGAHVMGFDQEKTTHHFLIYLDGGAIDVSVKDQANTTDLTAIRQHLPRIAMAFGNGEFDLPMLVHATRVPGTAEMARLKAAIRYRFVETAGGGRVGIVTADPAALAAVHAFLKFQIDDHRTGDSPIPRSRTTGR